MPARALIFHYFEGGLHPAGQGALTSEAFAQFLRRFGPERILPAAEWLERAERGRLGADDVCLSFDDGLLSQFDVALPVLDSFGLTALWFPYTSPLTGAVDLQEVFRFFRAVHTPDVNQFYAAFDRACAGSVHADTVAAGLDGFVAADYLSQYAFYSDGDRKFRYLRDRVLGEAAYFEVMQGMVDAAGMNVADIVDKLWIGGDQMRALHRGGHVIGLHSHQHPVRMAALPQEQQHADYRVNLGMIEDVTGTRPVCVAYPCNSYDQGTIAFLSGLGVKVGFRNTMAEIPEGGIMECPRQDVSQAAAGLV